MLLPLLLATFVCFAQEQEALEEEAATTPGSMNYANLVFGNPQLIIAGLDPITKPVTEFESPDETDSLATQVRAESILLYQQAIDQKELGGGPWQPSLIEELTAIAELQHQQGAYLESIQANSRAMQLSRINNGLNNLDQIPIVELLIQSHLALDQWDKADQYQNYLFYSQKSAFGLDDPRMIPVLENLAKWNLKTFRAQFGEHFVLRLTVAFYSFRAAADIVSLHFGENDERYAKYLRDMAGAAFLMAANAALIEEASRPEYASIQEMFENERFKIEPEQPRGYKEGLEALERLVAHFSSKPHEQLSHAKALISLADWHLLFQRRGAAADIYEEAYGKITDLDNGLELAVELLGQITPLPAFSSSIQEIDLESRLVKEQNSTQQGVADVKFDTTELGVVVNLEVLTAQTDENVRILSQLRREVRGTLFRPVIENGDIVRTQGNHVRYRYSY